MASKKLKVQVGLDFTSDQMSIEKIGKQIDEAVSAVKINLDPESAKKFEAELKELGRLLQKHLNPNTGKINAKNLVADLDNNENFLMIEKLGQRYAEIGVNGQQSFRKVANEADFLNKKIGSSNKTLEKMGTTLMNTIRWNISSSVVNAVTGEFQKMYYFAKDLDRTLTDIRIVSGQSADQMERFAIHANESAKALGVSTVEYAQAATLFFQQGLGDADVKKMTEGAVMASRITGIAAADMADLLTSTMNGYKLAADEVMTVTDKLAAVGATTAADFNELATGMSKVASMANTAGVSIDELNAQIATIVSVTRESPESIGTSLKTIYGRMLMFKTNTKALMEDDDGEVFGAPKVEEALQAYNKVAGAQISLFKTSADGGRELRDLGEVIEEIGNSWDTVTDKTAKFGIATALAGSRQQNRLVALFDSWDMYKDTVETSLNAEGTTLEQNAIYMESYEGKIKGLQAAKEELYMVLTDSDSMKSFIGALTQGVQLFTKLADMAGGFSAVLGLIGVAFSDNLVKKAYEFQQSFVLPKEMKETGKDNEQIESLKELHTISKVFGEDEANRYREDLRNKKATLKELKVESQLLLEKQTLLKDISEVAEMGDNKAKKKAISDSLMAEAAARGVAVQSAEELRVKYNELAEAEQNLKELEQLSYGEAIGDQIHRDVEVAQTVVDGLRTQIDSIHEKATEAATRGVKAYKEMEGQTGETSSEISAKAKEAEKLKLATQATRAAFMLLPAAISGATDSSKSLGEVIKNIGMLSIPSLASALKPVIVSLGVAKDAAGALNASMLLAPGIIAGITLATMALTAIIKTIKGDTKAAAEMIATAKENASTSKSLSLEISDLTLKYNKLSEEVKTNADVKDDLMTTQNELLTKLGLEGQSIDTLIEKYDSLSEAIKKASLDQLKDSEISLRANYSNEKNSLLDSGKYKWSDNEQETISFSSKKHYDELTKLLKDAGLNVSDGKNKNTGSLVLDGDVKTTAGILKNYQDIKKAIDVISNSGIYKNTDSMLKLDLYTKLQDRYTELNTVVGTYNSSISDLNTNLSQQQMLTALQGEELPKTKQEFTAFKDSLVESAIASGQFVGSQDQIKASIENFLATQPEFVSFFDIVTDSSDEGEKAIRSLKEALSDETISKSIDEYQKSIISVEKALKNLNNLSPTEIIDLMQDFPDLAKYGYTGSEGLDVLESALEKVGFSLYDNLDPSLKNIKLLKDMYDNAMDTSNAIISLSDALSNMNNSGKFLEDVNAEFKELGYISSDTLAKIASKSPELETLVANFNAGLIDTNDILAGLTTAYNKDLENYKIAVVEKIGQNEEFFKSIVKDLPDWVKNLADAYDIDYTNWKNLNDAKLDIYKDLKKKQSALDILQEKGASGGYISMYDAKEMQKLRKEIADAERMYDQIVGDIGTKINLDKMEGYKPDPKDKTGATGEGKNSINELFDWIAVRIEKLREKSQKEIDKIANYISYKNKNKQIDIAIKTKVEEQSTLKDLQDKYNSAAKKIKLPKKYQELVNSGGLNIENIEDKELVEKINEYTKWKKAADEVGKSISEIDKYIKELNSQKLDNISSYFDIRQGNIDSKISQTQSQIDLRENRGLELRKKDYNKLIKLQAKSLKYTNDEYIAYKKQFDLDVESGKIKKYSEEWYNALIHLNNINKTANQTKIEINGIIDDATLTKLDKFNKSIEKIDSVLSEIDFTSGIVEKDSIEQIALFQSGFSKAKEKSKELASAIKKLKKEYKSKDGQLSKDAYEEELSRLEQAQRTNAQAMQGYQNNIVSAMKNRYDKQLSLDKNALDLELKSIEKLKKAKIDALNEELDKYKKIIDERKKALRDEQKTDDYNREVEEAIKEITKLEDRIGLLREAEFTGDREAGKERRDTEEELAKKRSELTKKQRDREVDLMTDSLDEESKKYEELKKQQIKDIEDLYDKSMDDLKEEYDKKEINLKNLYETESNLIKSASKLTRDEANATFEHIQKLMKEAYNIQVSYGLGSAIGTSNNTGQKSTTPSTVKSYTDILGKSTKANKSQDKTGISNLNKFLVDEGYGIISQKKMIQLAKSLGLNNVTVTDSSKEGKANKELILSELKKRMGKFANTGMVNATKGGLSSIGEDGIVAVRDKEIILDRYDSDTFRDFVPVMKDLMQEFKTPKLSTTNNNPSPITLEINFNGDADRNTVSQLRNVSNDIVDKLVKEIKKR